MRFKQILVCTVLTALAFGGGVLLGTEIAEEPETVTMAAPGKEEHSILSPQPVTPSPSLSPLPTPKTPETEYLLMLSGEHICIYELLENGGTDLVQKTEVDTAQLRQEDYENLCRGLTVDSLEEARSLCEDFGN